MLLGVVDWPFRRLPWQCATCILTTSNLKDVFWYACQSSGSASNPSPSDCPSCASWTMVAIMTDTSKPGIFAAQMLQNVHMGLVPIPPSSRKPAQLFWVRRRQSCVIEIFDLISWVQLRFRPGDEAIYLSVPFQMIRSICSTESTRTHAPGELIRPSSDSPLGLRDAPWASNGHLWT